MTVPMPPQPPLVDARNAEMAGAWNGAEGEDWAARADRFDAASAAFDPALLDVTINGVKVCQGCAPGEPRELVDLSGRLVEIGIDLHAGPHAVTVWTNDLTPDYVHENSAYST